MKFGIVVFVLAMALFAAIAWVAGFDFDHRGPNVGGGVVLSIYTAIVVAFLASMLKGGD